MNDLFASSVTYGIILSILCFQIGTMIQRKWKSPLLNPFILATFLCIGFLLIFKVDYENYNKGGQFITYLLTPATVCLAVPLYEKIDILKKNKSAILIGVVAGVLTNLTCIYLLSLAFGLNHQEYVTLLPKSVTTAIAIGASEEMGGMVTITIVAVLISGTIGNVFGDTLCRIFRIKSPLSQGLAIGNASHALGTAKAMEMGTIQGAMSGLTIAVAGLTTIIMVSIYSNFI